MTVPLQKEAMDPREKILETFNGLVGEFMERSPFFRVWREGSVDRAMADKFLTTFDSLVKNFPILIAAGATRARDEETRCVLAANLFQECGEGDTARTHHAIYRKFLATAGIPLVTLTETPFAAQWRNSLMSYLTGSSTPPAALGALAAGEFLAQPVLGRIFPLLKPLYPQADAEYFTQHLELEIEHVREITGVLAGWGENEAEWKETVSGFKFGLTAWETYFKDLAAFVAEKQTRQIRPF